MRFRVLLTMLLVCAGRPSLAEEVPPGSEVRLVDLIPGKLGAVTFRHQEHSRDLKWPDGSDITCNDCHHRQPYRADGAAAEVLPCSACHAKLGEPLIRMEGQWVRAYARLNEDGAVDYRSLLFHDYCVDACHRKLTGLSTARHRPLMACKACHERGISPDVIHGRYDTVRQPGAELTWLRCPVGQTWSTGSQCLKDAALLAWQETAEACPKGFRLPRRQELGTFLASIGSYGLGATLWVGDEGGVATHFVQGASLDLVPAEESTKAMVWCVQ